MEYSLCSDRIEFEGSDLVKINYSNKQFSDEALIYNSGLLNELGINNDYNKTIEPVAWENTPIFFNINEDYLLPFDIFSAIFYLISRYEEYHNNDRDEHDRYRVENSLAYKYNFLDIPVVNIWVQKFINRLSEKYSGISKIAYRNTSYQFVPTIDVDNAWAIKNKGLIRTIGGIIKSGESDYKLSYRIKVLLGREKDPYDNFTYLKTIHDKNNLKPIYFFLLGNYGLFDKNSHYLINNYRKLICNIDKYATTGIHPSYNSNRNIKLLRKEITRLDYITGQKQNRSRQHFLKFKLPYTYTALEDSGITEDYSMGYSSAAGFRAGTCTPFSFYNLLKEKSTNLKVFPFQVMDICLRDSLNLNQDEAKSKLSYLINNVKKVNGTFISLWHNESLSESGDWDNWRSVYEYLVKSASSNV